MYKLPNFQNSNCQCLCSEFSKNTGNSVLLGGYVGLVVEKTQTKA